MSNEEIYERKTNSEWMEKINEFCTEHFAPEGTRNLLDFYEVIQYAIAEELSEQHHYEDAHKIKADNPSNPYMKSTNYINTKK